MIILKKFNKTINNNIKTRVIKSLSGFFCIHKIFLTTILMVINVIKDIINTNWHEIMLVSERAIISLIFLFFMTKLIGKKQVSELSLFDYVISISIGNFAAEMTTSTDTQVLNGLFGVLIFGFVALFVSYLTMKSIILRRIFMGRPTILMENGRFVYKNLKRVKMDINDFLETARIAGYFDVSKIKYALMEANGKISFMLKEENNPVTIKDMNLKASKDGLVANVIIDGKIMKKNLSNINKDRAWLLKQLKVSGKNVKDILLATVDVNEKLAIYEKRDSVIKNVLE